MPKLAINPQKLRRAMRDPRYANIGDREHDAYRAWVTEGFQALQSASPGEGGTITVEVRAYDRVRDGRRERLASSASAGADRSARRQGRRRRPPNPWRRRHRRRCCWSS